MAGRVIRRGWRSRQISFAGFGGCCLSRQLAKIMSGGVMSDTGGGISPRKLPSA